jgi:hypothetical protein
VKRREAAPFPASIPQQPFTGIHPTEFPCNAVQEASSNHNAEVYAKNAQRERPRFSRVAPSVNRNSEFVESIPEYERASLPLPPGKDVIVPGGW